MCHRGRTQLLGRTLFFLLFALVFALPASAATGTPTPASATQPASHHQVKVEVYGTSWCPWCQKTLAYFRSRGIAVKDYDVEKDPAAARRKQQLDPGPGIPTVVVNGQVISGYSPAAFADALKRAR